MKLNIVKIAFALSLAVSLTTAAPSTGNPEGSGMPSLIVSGHPVDKNLLRFFAAERALEEFSQTGGKAAVDFSSFNIPSSLSPGESVVLEVPINIFGEGGSRQAERVNIVAKNVGLDGLDDSRLMISNDPEEVREEGVLLEEELLPNEPLRVLSYHKAAAGKRFFLNASIFNPNPYEISLFTSKGLGGPCPDGIYAGHVATRRFLKQERHRAGTIVKIPPNTGYTLSKQVLKENEVSTSIMKLHLLSGRNAVVKIAACREDSPPSDLPLRNDKKEDGRLSGTIEKAYVDISKKYLFGSPPLDIRIGEGPTFFSKSKGFDINLGNYGMLHRIKLEIVNNSNKKRAASLYYVASGGPTRGTFIIDGSIIQTGLLDPKEKKSERIAVIPVGGMEKTSISILMMPQPGSYYPTRFVLLEGAP
jgi:hypothetical protein